MGGPTSHEVLIVDGDAGGWLGNLCDLGAISFSVSNGGGSLLDIGAGASGADATVNVFSQEYDPDVSGSGAGHMGPFSLDSEGGLHVRCGDFLQITAYTDRDQQIFFGRITAVEAVQNDRWNATTGWQREWSIRATNLAVDLNEHTYEGTLPFTIVPPDERFADLLAGAGSWWPIVPVILDLDGGSGLRIDKVMAVATADMGTIAAELDRTATSCWCWYTFARDPWRFGYSTAYRSLIRIVPRESNWRVPTSAAHFRDREYLIGDPWITGFPDGTYAPGHFSHVRTGMRVAVDNDSYLYAVHVVPYNGANTTWDITGDETWGRREATFDGHIGESTGHADSQTPGSPPSGGGGAGWQIATAWADSTTFERLTFTDVTWDLTADQAVNGDLLDIDRLDGMWIIWDEKNVPVRVKAVRITGSGGSNWQVSVDLERVKYGTDLGIPVSPP